MRLLFDHGTLICEAMDDLARQGLLPGVLWDPRVGRFRAPAFQYGAIASVLQERGTPWVDDASPLPRPGGNLWGALELRPYQQAALLAWARERERGMVVLPTGSGKTRLACAAMAATDVPALCLVPTRALLQQWRGLLAQHYRGAIGCLGDGERQVEDVTIATYEAAYRQMQRIGGRFGLLVVDEVHHFGTGIRDEALEMCAAPRRLGLTATAPAGEALARVTELIGPVVCELGVRDLAGRWLADFDSVILRLRLSPDERTRYDREMDTFRQVFRQFRRLMRGGTWDDFVRLASHTAEGRTALAAFRSARRLISLTLAKQAALAELLARHRDSRILVFTSDNAAAYAIAREHLVMPITCDIGRREREQALGAFRTGKLRVLVSARVLNEGIDVPDADLAIIVGGVQGEREHVQRVGRLLRPRPGKRALVYELVTMATYEAQQSRQRRRGLAPAVSAIV
jgi:superfamily II DNA or RNA helicase